MIRIPIAEQYSVFEEFQSKTETSEQKEAIYMSDTELCRLQEALEFLLSKYDEA